MPSLTVLDLITEALEEIGASAAGEPLSTADQTKALAVLKRLVLSSNINRGNIATLRIDQWTLVSGQQTYTIGIDPAAVPVVANFVAVRPNKIERANVLLQAGGTIVRRKLNLLDDDQWAAKAFQAIDSIPLELYNDMAYPLSTYYFYPIPDQAYVIETYTWQQFAQAAVTDVLAIPEGYYEFWLYSCAIRLCGPFGRTPNPTTIETYNQVRSDVMALNTPSPRIRSDAGLESTYGSTYNWLTGLCDNDNSDDY